MPWGNELELRWLKSKNDKTKSAYLHLCECNIGRKRALATFTVQAMQNKQDQLLLIKKIKNYFSKKLQNLKCDVQYFSVIELGRSRSNPHLHVQLFYNEEDLHKVEKAYQKCLEFFLLVNKRCKLVKEFGEASDSPLSFNYIIKEFDNLKLSDKEILDLDAARKRLKQGKTKNLQFFSKSRVQHPHPLSKALLFKHNLTYMNVNTLMNGYAKRLQGLKLLEARQINELPYILFKDGAIRINSSKLYNLILLTLLYIGVIKSRSSERFLYRNKENESSFHTNKKINIKKFNIIRVGLRNLKVRTLYTVINI